MECTRLLYRVLMEQNKGFENDKWWASMTKGIFVIFGQDSTKVRPLFSPSLECGRFWFFFQGQITCSLSFNTICLNFTFWWTGTETIGCTACSFSSLSKIEICSFDQGCLWCYRHDMASWLGIMLLQKMLFFFKNK